MTVISPEGKKDRVDELFKAHFIKMIERCICMQLWKNDRVAAFFLQTALQNLLKVSGSF